MKLPAHAAALFAAALIAVAPLPAAAQDFYKGKTVTIIVGFSPGGTYDATARVLAKHLGEHLPGKPTVIVQTMLGAGGINAVQHLYYSAVRDGTVIGMPPRNYPIAPYGNDQLKYDGRRFNAIGSTTTEVQIGAVWHSVPVRHFDDTLNREITLGITSYADDIGTLTLLTKNLTGAKFKIVSGYPGGNDITAAIEKGEVDGEFGWSWGSVKARAKRLLDEKKIKILFQIGSRKAEDLPDTPFIMDYAKTDRDRQALELLMAPDAFAWPFVAPPEIPAARLAELRRAFDAAMTNAGFLADAAQAKLEINPMGGEAMQALIEHVLSFDASVVERVKELLKPPS